MLKTFWIKLVSSVPLNLIKRKRIFVYFYPRHTSDAVHTLAMLEYCISLDENDAWIK